MFFNILGKTNAATIFLTQNGSNNVVLSRGYERKLPKFGDFWGFRNV